MFLGLILMCSSISDATTCDVGIQKMPFYATEQLCRDEVYELGQDLVEAGMYIKVKCFDRTQPKANRMIKKDSKLS